MIEALYNIGTARGPLPIVAGVATFGVVGLLVLTFKNGLSA